MGDATTATISPRPTCSSTSCGRIRLVMGNRFRAEFCGRHAAAAPLSGQSCSHRDWTIVLQEPVGDFHCGLRAFRRDAIERLDLRTHEWNSPVKWWSRRRHSACASRKSHDTFSRRARPRAAFAHLEGWLEAPALSPALQSALAFSLPRDSAICFGNRSQRTADTGPRIIGNVQFDINTLLFAAMAILIGFQSVVFAAFTKIFAISEGLMPADPLLSKMFRYSLSRPALSWAFCLYWLGPARGPGPRVLAKQSLWSLDPEKALRIVIPGAVSVTLGFQIILSSFFLSVLGWPADERRWNSLRRVRRGLRTGFIERHRSVGRGPRVFRRGPCCMACPLPAEAKERHARCSISGAATARRRLCSSLR